MAPALGANEHMHEIADTFNRAVMKSRKDKGKTLVVWYDINVYLKTVQALVL
jgi:N-acetyl-beta-hexosaminidase